MATKLKASGQEEGAYPPRCRLRNLSWLLLVGAWLLVATAMLSYDPTDWPSHLVARHNENANNWVGAAGALIAHKVYLMFGPGAWILLGGVAVAMVVVAMGRKLSDPALRGAGLFIMAVSTSAIVALGAPQGLSWVSIDGGRPEGSGGLVAFFINQELVPRFNLLGTILILGVAFWIGAILVMDQAVLALLRIAWRLFSLVRRVPVPILVGKLPRLALFGGGVATLDRETVKEDRISSRGERVARDVTGTESFDPDKASAVRGGYAEERDESDGSAEQVEADDNQGGAPTCDDADGQQQHDAPATYLAEKNGSYAFSEDELRAKIKKLPINFAAKTNDGQSWSSAAGGGISRDVDLSGYRFPDLTLLEEPETNFTHEHERIVRDQAVALESALQEYRIEGEVVGIDSGPVIALYEVRLAPGTKVSRVTAIASDLARALKAQNIRVVPNMVGKDTVGIEVPNVQKEKVRLKELMIADPEGPKRMKLPMWLGKDASGKPLVGDLTTMPHLLIAGTTGSGKSVCMNAIIISFLYTKRPDELKLVLVDPKMVEMSMFKDIPHLMCPVVTEMPKAAAILEWATNKMDERYELLAEASVRDLASYNSLTWDDLKERFNPQNEEEEARIPKKLPYIVLIVDELADLMITTKEVEGVIGRLGQKARAVGLHLILATQRPQANVVTGLIKGNMPARISFKVASGLDSRIVLDQKGAEVLLGQGDMLYLSPRTSKLMRAQGTLVDDQEIRRTVQFLKEVAAPSFEPQLVQIKAQDLGESDEERDPLFDDAVRIVLESRRGSVSLLQRRLAIGYSRSSRLIEQMAAADIIGNYKGSQAREVTMTLDEYEALVARAEVEAQDCHNDSPDTITKTDDKDDCFAEKARDESDGEEKEGEEE